MRVLQIALVCMPILAFGADVVPYSVKSIRVVGEGYVELIGPGKMEVNGEVLDYDGTKYIRVDHIGTLSGVTGASRACVLAYSSEGYTENISVLDQSCDEILEVIKGAK